MNNATFRCRISVDFLTIIVLTFLLISSFATADEILNNEDQPTIPIVNAPPIDTQSSTEYNLSISMDLIEEISKELQLRQTEIEPLIALLDIVNMTSSQLDNLHDKLIDAQRQRSVVISEFNAANITIADLKLRLEAEELRVLNAIETLNTATDVLERRQAELIKKNQKISTLEQELKFGDQKLILAQDEITSREQQIAMLENQIIVVRNQIKNDLDDMRQAAATSAADRQLALVEVDRLRQEINQQDEIRDNLINQIHHKNRVISTMDESEQNVIQSLKHLQKEIEAHRIQREAVFDEISSLPSKALPYLKKIEQLTRIDHINIKDHSTNNGIFKEILLIKLDSNSYELSSQAKMAIQLMINNLGEKESALLKIIGRADAIGRSEINYVLGLQRAQSVQDSIRDFTTMPLQIIITSEGEKDADRFQTNEDARSVSVQILQ